MSTNEPSLTWLARAGSEELASRATDGAKTLRSVLRGAGDASDVKELPADPALLPALDNVLRACSREGDGGLDETAAKSLAFPALKIAQTFSTWVALAEALSACNQRPALNGNPAIARLLVEGMDVVRTSSEVPPESGDLRGEVPADIEWQPQLLDEHFSSYDASALAVAWTVARQDRQDDDRWAIDASLLDGLRTRRRPIPTALAEALYVEDCWASRSFVKWVEDLPRPLSEADAGLASAALLNARVRDVRPHLFLRHPDVRVVDVVSAQKSPSSGRSEESGRSIAEPLHRARLVVEGELDRASPRKKPLESAVAMLRSCLSRLGMETFGTPGSVMPFDPVEHLGDEDLATNEQIIVVRPGLRETASGAVVLRAGVARSADEEPITTEEMGTHG
jgi:hypothetical protein